MADQGTAIVCKDFLDEFSLMEKVIESGVSWDIKYTLVFSGFAPRLMGTINMIGGVFTWVDPDASYEDDVLAFYHAMRPVAEIFKKYYQLATGEHDESDEGGE